MTTCIAFVGTSSGVGATTLIVNTATILGVVARRRTLLLDLSGNARGVCDLLGGSNTGGVLKLISPWLGDGVISPKELLQQIGRYDPGGPWMPGASALDILPGFDRAMLSPTEAENIYAFRGAHLVGAICQAAYEAGYEFVLWDNGVWQPMAGGIDPFSQNEIVLNAKHVVLVSKASEDGAKDVQKLLPAWRATDQSILVVFNMAGKLFNILYDIDLGGLPYQVVPSIDATSLADCEERGVPAALCGLEYAQKRRERFVKASVAIARRLAPQLGEVLHDSQGQPL
jgi:hypothetical protein